MTNKEAINLISRNKSVFQYDIEMTKALDLAIKVLETGEVYMTGEDYNLYMEGYKDGKKDFEPKQGEWIISEYVDTRRGFITKCPFCKIDTIGGGNFCPNCGAKMKGGKE